MQHKDSQTHNAFNPHSILIVGCGLIGASFAYGLKQALGQDCTIDGVERNPLHRQTVIDSGVFSTVYSAVPESDRVYDLAVLSVPVDTATALLYQVSRVAELIMDVCSVKEPICEAAETLHLEDRFAPTHPMAGIASEGPADATADLFLKRSWLTIEGWSVAAKIRPLIERLGAVWGTVESPQQHDRLMAAVSHSIHLTSLASMLAYDNARANFPEHTARYCGPAFRDITRLSASPSGFWTSTLLSNRKPTAEHIHRIIDQLQRFADELEQGDESTLRQRLNEAREARRQWEMEKGSIGEK